ncbi:hypothetical protein PCC7418_2081 [Halothece sp. PCC 7418]|uniref:uroporphyrinogen-III C-methyltransferase n=1 Tax=Halothece sp. (strain PCC 7418) TaxID=65093 RepID=UPI0002A07A74|nr:uroporphyrinogen-III C-methyltransferase [Halothece sp. PCC 7418]AFZ44244.1 hypothetical protein PCC7418_2081 [Halothece sp. PCC 7418]
MNPQSFPDYNNPDASPSQSLPQTVEELEVKLERLQALAQTLIGGLIVAILITIGVSGWFAYRLILQEQTARRKAQEFEQTEIEFQDRLDTLEQRLLSQQEKIERLQEQIPENLETINNAVDSNQQEIERLQEQLQKTESSSEQESTDQEEATTSDQ